MKEYEYIMLGIESFLVDELVGVICQENLESRHYPDGFRRIFDNYRLLRKNFSEKAVQLGTTDFPETALESVMAEYVGLRNRYLQSFLEDIDANYPDLEVFKLADNYFRTISNEDVVTTEKRICIYPYIVSQIRLYEEGK